MTNIAPHELSEDQRRTKRLATVWTVVYLVCFVPLAFFALFTMMVFDSPSMTVPVGISIMIAAWCIPLSIPVSIYLIWSNYSSGRYKRARYFCALPIIMMGVAFLVNACLQLLFIR